MFVIEGKICVKYCKGNPFLYSMAKMLIENNEIFGKTKK